MIHEIEIKEPIWYNRSVGLNTLAMDDKDSIDVTISYRNKEEKLLYPGTFRIPVAIVRTFERATVKGTPIGLNIVPIVALENYLLRDELDYIGKQNIPIEQTLFKESEIKPPDELSGIDEYLLKINNIASPAFSGTFRDIRIVLRGEPLAKQSTRFFVKRDKQGNVFTYKDPAGRTQVIVDTYTDSDVNKKQKEWRSQIEQQLITNYPGWIPFSEEVHVTKFECIFKIHENFPKYKIHQIENRTAIFYKNTKPDLPDNLKKIPFDAMNGLVFVDDNIVVSENGVLKRYGIRPGIIIEMKGK